MISITLLSNTKVICSNFHRMIVLINSFYLCLKYIFERNQSGQSNSTGSGYADSDEKTASRRKPTAAILSISFYPLSGK